jgi:Protein of unknown function (DUF3037)
MTIQQPYTYTILRYVHDVTTGEFVNVGVVMHLPREGRAPGQGPYDNWADARSIS